MKDLDHLKLPRAGETSSRFTKEQALAAQKFHQTLPGYSVTRLVELPALAKELGVKDIFVKDEASRFGLRDSAEAIVCSICFQKSTDGQVKLKASHSSKIRSRRWKKNLRSSPRLTVITAEA